MKISQIARKNLSKSIIFMIALAAMLISAVLCLGFSVQQTLIDEMLETVGDNHARFGGVTVAQTDTIAADRRVALADTHLSLGSRTDQYAWVQNHGDIHSGLDVRYSSALGQVAGYRLDNGRPPTAANEAVIPPHAAELFGIEAKIGEQFTMVYRAGDGAETAHTFTVSGVLQQQRMHAVMGLYPIFVSEVFAETFPYERDVFVRFRSGRNPRETAFALAELAGIPENRVHFNEQYLAANLNDTTTIIFVAVIILILAAAGALVIYNAYNLSIVKKVNQYGLLTVIGASKKQIRRCVLLEAMYCTALGLPLGLLLGTLLGHGGMMAFNATLDAPVRFYITPWAYVLSAIVTVAMVLTGVSRPAHKASQIAPVEAIRFSGAEEKAVKRKTVASFTVYTLAKINMLRAKKRLIGTVLSLALSGMLFLAFSTVAFSMRDSAGNLISQIVPGDIVITTGVVSRQDDPLPLDTVRQINGVQDISTFMQQFITRIYEMPDGTESAHPDQQIIGVETDTMLDILNHVPGSLTLADFENPYHVIAMITEFTDDMVKYYLEHGVDVMEIEARHAVGSVLDLTPFDLYHWEPTKEEKSFTVIGLVKAEDIPPYMTDMSLEPMLFTLQSNFPALGFNEDYCRVVMNVDDEKHDDVFAAVTQLASAVPELGVVSHKNMIDELTRQMTGVIVIVMLMLGVVALNGIMNLIGTTFMGIEQRKKELGVLMAMGLSPKAVRKMLSQEGLWVSAFCAALSAALGLGLGIGLYHMLYAIGADYLQWSFPIWPLVTLITLLGIVPFTITRMAVHRLQKSTIVELLGRV